MNSKMVQFILDNGIMEIERAGVNSTGMMEVFTKAIGETVSLLFTN